MSHTEHPDDDLQALLQGLPQAEPSAELDEAILAQAEQALAPAGAANDEYYPGARKPFLHRHRIALSLAATVLIGANLVLLEPVERPPATPAATIDINMVQTPPPAAPEVALTAPAAPAMARPEAAPIAAPAPAPAVIATSAAAPAAAPEAAPPSAPAPAAEAIAPEAEVAAAPKPEPSLAGAPDARARKAAPPAPPGLGAAERPLRQITVTGSRLADQREHASAEDALRQLLTLEQQGDLVALAKAWQDFRRRFPGHAVEPALRARLDALPPPPPGD